MGRANDAASESVGEQGPRFFVDEDGTTVDTQSTPPGSYDQPNGGRTDILQEENHGAGRSHTHNMKYNTNPKTGQRFPAGTNKGDAVSYDDVKNIEGGSAPRSEPKGR